MTINNWWAYLLIGLVIVIAASKRQFDEPSWESKEEVTVLGLPPVDIVGPRRYRSARNLYVGTGIATFLLLCLSEHALRVAVTAIDAVQSASITAAGQSGGDVPREGDDEAATGMFSLVAEMQTRPEFPILFALLLVSAMRLPPMQRVEQALRGWAHRRYGIPTRSETLYRRLSSARIDVEALDAALQHEPTSEAVSPMIQAYVGSAQNALGDTFDGQAMARNLVKVIAYRVWLKELHVWPVAETLAGSPTLARWNDRVLRETNALEQELKLLSDDQISWGGEATSDDRKKALQRIRKDRWERCDREIERLSSEVCSLIVLLDQRSPLPDESRPVASVLRALLGNLRREEALIGGLVDRVGVLVLAIPLISGGVGAYRALGWQRIATQAGASPETLTERNFDATAIGIEFALNSLTVYGTAALVGGLMLGRSHAQQDHGAALRPVVPRLIGAFVACFVAVALVNGVHQALFQAYRHGWDQAAITNWLLGIEHATVRLWVGQSVIGGFFGLFISQLTTAHVEDWRPRRRAVLAMSFVAAMALAGIILAFYLIEYARIETLHLHLRVYTVLTVLTALAAVLLLNGGRRSGRSNVIRTKPSLKRGLASGLVAVILITGPSEAIADDSVARVGMRSDAKPFAWLDETGVFHGFLVDLCRAAVEGTGRRIEEIEITSDSRFNPSLGLDLICDPTTITRARAARHDFTPVIFIANGGFLTNSTALPLNAAVRQDADCFDEDAIEAFGVGLLSATTAVAAYDRARAGNELTVPLGTTLCRVAVDSHVDGISRLCAGELRHYFGDIDILRAYVEDHSNCTVELHPTFRTYEPYALILATSDASFRRAFIAALYEVFADGTARTAFDDSLGTARAPSDAVQFLFRMLRIPAGGEE